VEQTPDERRDDDDDQDAEHTPQKTGLGAGCGDQRGQEYAERRHTNHIAKNDDDEGALRQHPQRLQEHEGQAEAIEQRAPRTNRGRQICFVTTS
jgi:hypothetical protein